MIIRRQLSQKINQNVLLKFGSEIAGRLASFGLLLWAARQLGAVGFGHYNYALAWGFVLAQVADLGLQLLISREVAVRDRAARPFLNTAIWLKLALSLVVITLLAIVTWAQPPALRRDLFLIGLMPLTNTFLEFAAHVFRGQQRLQIEAGLLAAARLTTVVLGFLILWLGGGLTGLALTNLGATLLFVLVGLYLLRKEGWLGAAEPRDKTTSLRLLREALPLGIAIFLSITYTRLALFLLQAQLGETAVAHFSAAYRLVEPAQIVPASILAAVFPAISQRLTQEPRQAQRLAIQTSLVLLLLGAGTAVFLWFTAPWLIPLLYPASFAPSQAVLQILGLSLLFSFVNYGLTHFLIAAQQQRLVGWFTAVMLVLHALLSWQLIPRWGTAGPAISIIIAEAFLFIACLIVLRKKVNTLPQKQHHLTQKQANGRLAPFLHQIGLALLIVLAVLLPFELERPLLHLGPLALTNLEILHYAILFCSLSLWLLTTSGQTATRPTQIPRSWLWLAAIFTATLLLTSLTAPEFRSNALKATLRTLSGILLIPATLQLLHTQHAARQLMAALVASGLFAGLIGLIEHWQGVPLPWVALFRTQPTVVGPFLRLSGTFDYANQTAMYSEATFPLLLAFATHLLLKRQPKNFSRKSLYLLLPTLYLQIGILTFSRANFATQFLAAAAVAAALWLWQPRAKRHLSFLWAGAATAVLLLITLNYLLSPTFRLRLSNEGDANWYKAELDVPAALTLAADEIQTVSVTIHNTGDLIWHSAGSTQFRLAARWQRTDDANRELAFQPRWPFERAIRPNQTITLEIPLRAPAQKGDYRLTWDIVHENVTWFAAKGSRAEETAVTVIGEPHGHSSSQFGTTSRAAIEFEPPIPGRLTLWRIALDLWRERPFLGVGLDNYRLLYGRFLDTPDWNNTVHTNNWYIEMIVSLGIASLPWFIWLLFLLKEMANSLRRPSVTLWQTAVVVAILAFLIHGLLDYFLLFNATGLLFWLLIALLLRLRSV